MKALILGVSGMIGSGIFKKFSNSDRISVFGTSRRSNIPAVFNIEQRAKIISSSDITNEQEMLAILKNVRPDAVINCIGITKHVKESADKEYMMITNAQFPQWVSAICDRLSVRFIQISTDCVFSGKDGSYTEDDIPDAEDAYGQSKILGEVRMPTAVTIRTSTIGPELDTCNGLFNWFMCQGDKCYGYRNAIFSGVTTNKLAEILHDYILPNNSLSGLYHVSGPKISKFDLLKLIANRFGKHIEIIEDNTLRIDRSLDGSRFEQKTGYVMESWHSMITRMKTDIDGETNNV